VSAPNRPPQRFDPLGTGSREPLALLHFAFRAVTTEPDARLAALGLGRVHHRILFFIAQTPQLRVVDLMATLAITKQALNGPLRQLVRQGFVKSQADPGDLRQRRLSLSASGKTLERRLSGHQRRAFAAAFRQAGAGAQRGWHAVMLELIRSKPNPDR
jgi:DNA-binding MarR family transcriptional regulator